MTEPEWWASDEERELAYGLVEAAVLAVREAKMEYRHATAQARHRWHSYLGSLPIPDAVTADLRCDKLMIRRFMEESLP